MALRVREKYVLDVDVLVVIVHEQCAHGGFHILSGFATVKIYLVLL